MNRLIAIVLSVAIIVGVLLFLSFREDGSAVSDVAVPSAAPIVTGEDSLAELSRAESVEDVKHVEMSNSPEKPQVVENTDIPDLVLQDLAGNDVSLVDLAGTPLVLNSWATWCPFCVHELPDFVTVQEEVGDNVLFVAINRRESLTDVTDYLTERGLSGKLLFLQDSTDSFYSEIGAISMPETLFINSDGTLSFHKRGVMPIDEIRQRVAELK